MNIPKDRTESKPKPFVGGAIVLPSVVDAFVSESNRIEGMFEVTVGEQQAHTDFLRLNRIGISDVERFVSRVAGVGIRDQVGANVQIGNHVAPLGGVEIKPALANILRDVNDNRYHPWALHRQYETLHPFMDGNGRSGRVVWAWQMLKFGYHPSLRLGFLHAFYYQTLEHSR